nr:FAD-dependent oxidoreductase [Bacilli bacterium]
DVIIIGSGAVGSFIARSLTRYQLQILVLEKENDVGDGGEEKTSKECLSFLRRFLAFGLNGLE